MNEEMKKRCRRRVIVMVIVITILVILSILQSGCGKLSRGGGMIIEGIGDGVGATGRFLQETSNVEDQD